MAKENKRAKLETDDNNFSYNSKISQCLTTYSSTVFACETSADTRYIKCDFPCCSLHSTWKDKPPWMLNTLRNVKTLEKHVGQEVAHFMKQNLPISFDENSHLQRSCEIIASKTLQSQTRKVLVVFNLADPQSLLGEWIASFLNAAHVKHVKDICDIEVITQSFTSRYELMSCIAKLEFITLYPNVDVIAMLSCHSSSQGQVFSCTPSVISRRYKYEEFCSLHDFVQILQDILGQSLSAIHISSCFTLKLDCSHQDWPVDVEWLKTKLRCTLSGSTKEVYETGSQVADLYISLSTLLQSEDHSLGDHLNDVIQSARTEAFPDLALEMGLEIMSSQDAARKIYTPCIDEGVSAPSEVKSCLEVVLLIGYDANVQHSSISHQALADALAVNLNTRAMSDIKCKYRLINIQNGDASWQENLRLCFECVEGKLFFVALGSCWMQLNLLNVVQKEIRLSRKSNVCYGIHFQNVTSMQAYFLKTQLKTQMNLCADDSHSLSHPHIVVTSLVHDRIPNPVNSFPVLMYMIHLAIGENGERISGQGHIPAHLKYKMYKGPVVSRWTLEDVYMETCYVLSGLSRKAGLCLLSRPSYNFDDGSSTKKVNCNDEKTEAPMKDVQHEELSTHSGDDNTIGDSPSTSAKSPKRITGNIIGLGSSNRDIVSCDGLNNSSLRNNEQDYILAHCSENRITSNEKQTNSDECFSNEEISSGCPPMSADVEQNSSSFVVKGSFDSDPCLKYGRENCDNLSTSKNDSICDSIGGTNHPNDKTTSKVSLSFVDCNAANIPDVENSFERSDCPIKSQWISAFHNNGQDHFTWTQNTNNLDGSGQSDSGKSDRTSEMIKEVRERCKNEETSIDAKQENDVNSSSSAIFSKTSVLPIVRTSESDICVVDDESCSDSNWNESPDLPLMANVDEVLVTHYVLDLSVDFKQKVMSGDITLFLKPTSTSVLERQFQLCLDCSLVDIQSVEEISLMDHFTVRQYTSDNVAHSHPPDVFKVDKYKKALTLPYTLLPYAVRNWCVRIWKPEELGRNWPRCVRIRYRTRPEGKSLTWASDQDNRPCVFSPGAYINNRSLMPCQEPPIAMSTWQAAVHVPKSCRVLMSGNEIPVQKNGETDIETFLYEMNKPLPCSTLALAIGWFEFRETSTVALSSIVKCRVFSAVSVINDASKELLSRCAKYLSAACQLLGPYPFTRMDLVILPRCFACMGLMSPNMAFLSQSILSRDGSMCTRVAHEISHSWFGLLIGAKDWSEEWLSEGFATYMEEKILSEVEGWNSDEELWHGELSQILKHQTLLAEFQHADENMQRLRPNLPSVVTAAEAVRQSVNKERGKTCEPGAPYSTVTNGQVCSKKWTQIYYLKGYFLLHYMASLVGITNFKDFLSDYVVEYGGKLVNSEDFFTFFETRFPALREKNIKHVLIKEWLESHGLPAHVPKKIGSRNNYLINQVENEFTFWKKTDAVNKRKKTQKIRSKTPIKDHPILNDQMQIAVLLERLLERDTMARTTLTQMDNCYHFSMKNAEVRHRWCELVVKHSYYPGYEQVKRFLIEDQGMGIYLFGELLISQQPKQKQLVLDVLSVIGGEMDQCTLKTVQDMIEGID